MITAAVFVAKTLKQPKCPSTEEWIANCYPLKQCLYNKTAVSNKMN